MNPPSWCPMRILLALVLACIGLCAQVVQESFGRDPGPLDFIRGEGYEQAILQALTGDALVGRDAAGRVVPRLAEHWDWRNGALRFRIRRDARFADGSPVRLEDVLWTMKAIQKDSKASPTKRAMLQGVQARRVGGFLEVRADRPRERLLCDLAQVAIARAGHPTVGSGPFSLSMKEGEWHLAARSHFLAPRIQGLRFRLIADDQALLQNLQKGWLTLGVPPARRGLRPPPSHRELRQPLNAQLIVWSRVGAEPLRCLERWRQEAVPGDFFGGQAQPSRGLWPETLGFSPRSMAAVPKNPPRDARWEILYTTGDLTAEKLMLALRERARHEGVRLEPRAVEAAILFERLTRGDFQLACAVNVFDPHPWAILDLLIPEGAVNFSRWHHPRLSDLLPRLVDGKASAWNDLQSLWAENPTSLPLLDFMGTVWVDTRLDVAPSAQGLYLSTPGAAGWSWKP